MKTRLYLALLTVSLLVTLAAFPALAQPPAEPEVLVDRCDDLTGWGVNPGYEFPGADGKLALADDAKFGKVLRLDYDFTNGGNYVTAAHSLNIPKASAVSFWLRQDGGDSGVIRITDGTDQEHASGFPIKGNDWQKITLALDPNNFTGHWHGKSDGNWYFPLKGIIIGAGNTSATKKGSIYLRDLCFYSADPAMYYGLSLRTADPGSIAFTSSKGAPVTVLVANRLAEPTQATLRLSTVDWHGAKRTLPEEKITLGPRAVVKRTLTLDATHPEFYEASAEIVRDGKSLATESAGVVITDKPRNFGVDDPTSFFAIQQTTDGARTERLGVKWVRAGRDWRWGEMQQGNLMPADVSGIRRNHQLVMYNMTAYPPDWAAKLAGTEDFWVGKGSEDRVKLWSDFVEQTCRQSAQDVDTFEIQNEPDLTCMYQENLGFAAGVQRYLTILRAGAAAVRRGAPQARVAGIDVSGGDYDGGLKFSEAIEDQASDLIDVYTGHPYAGVRYFGPGLNPMWPVRNEERRKCLDTLAMIQRHGGRQHFWVGEKGWGLDVKEPALSEFSRDFARCLVQSMVIAHSVPGVERYYWFLEQGCNEGGYEYGLFRDDKPLPAALAYGTMANLLYHAAPFRSPSIADNIQAHCFTAPETGDGTLVLWAEGDRSTLNVPALPANWTALDMMGRPFAHGTKGGKLSVSLDRQPVYVRFAASAAGPVCAALSRATIATDNPLRLEAAYVSDLTHVAARLRNITTQPVSAELSAEASHQNVTVPGRATATISLPAPGDLLKRQGREIPVRLTVNGVTTSLPARVDLAACPRVADPKVSADLSAFADLSGFTLDQHSQVYPPDPGVGWSSPDDLSAKAWVAWDDRYLYFAARVHDKIHFAPNDGPDGFWNGDSIQLAIDPLNDAGPAGGYDKDDVEFGLVIGPNGAKAVQTIPTSRTLDVPVVGHVEGSETTYAVALPWNLVGAKPAAGKVLGFNFIVNQNNGNGRAYWMGLTPGIGEAKRPNVFKDLYLVP